MPALAPARIALVAFPIVTNVNGTGSALNLGALTATASGGVTRTGSGAASGLGALTATAFGLSIGGGYLDLENGDALLLERGIDGLILEAGAPTRIGGYVALTERRPTAVLTINDEE